MWIGLFEESIEGVKRKFLFLDTTQMARGEAHEANPLRDTVISTVNVKFALSSVSTPQRTSDIPSWHGQFP